MRANLDAFERRRLRPRMLTGNHERDTSVEVLGTPSPTPFFLAPIGVLSIAHPEGELAAARAAAALRIPFTLSSAASHSIEEIAEAMGDAPRWFQLYWVNDREICASFVSRAEAAGYAAIVVTLDTLTLGWRPRDLRNAYLPFLSGEGCAQFFSDPVFCSRLDKSPAEDTLGAAAMMLSTFPNLRLTWADLAWLREQTALPLLVKGVLYRRRRATRGGRGDGRHHRLEPRRPPGRRRRSPRSTRSSRCARRSTARCSSTAGSAAARTSSRRSRSARMRRCSAGRTRTAWPSAARKAFAPCSSSSRPRRI